MGYQTYSSSVNLKGALCCSASGTVTELIVVLYNGPSHLRCPPVIQLQDIQNVDVNKLAINLEVSEWVKY